MISLKRLGEATDAKHALAIEARAAWAEQQAWDTASRQRRIRRRGYPWPPPYPAQLTLIETYGWPSAVDTMGVCHAAPYCFACRPPAIDSWRAMSACLGSNRHVCYFCRYKMGSRQHKDGVELAHARHELVLRVYTRARVAEMCETRWALVAARLWRRSRSP